MGVTTFEHYLILWRDVIFPLFSAFYHPFILSRGRIRNGDQDEEQKKNLDNNLLQAFQQQQFQIKRPLFLVIQYTTNFTCQNLVSVIDHPYLSLTGTEESQRYKMCVLVGGTFKSPFSILTISSYFYRRAHLS